MKPLVRFTLSQTVFLNLIFVLLMVAGTFSLFQLPVERYPIVKFGKVFIDTYFPGASPSDVESLVTRKIEDTLEDIEDIEFIRSTSYRERSSIVIKFLDDTDYDSLYNEVRFKVLGILNELPDVVERPFFNMIETSDWLPAVNVNLVSDRNNRSLSLMAEEMKASLRQIPGVMNVKLQGEYIRQFHVYLDPSRMTALGVTFEDAAKALINANISIPAGSFRTPNSELMVVADERFRTRDQVIGTVIRRDLDGSFVTVEDVISSARLSYRDPFVITSLNGRNCVTLQVLKSEHGNALSIVKQVNKIVSDFSPQYVREGIEIILTQDSTVYIKDAIKTLGLNMALGVILVSLIIWYFMGIRNAGLITIGIPFSFLVAMIFMYLTGNSLNEITLFSFVLVSGIIVDDAILVLENIYRHIQEGEELRESIINGTSEVMMPVISATSTTVASFLPMLIMTGSTGEFFALIPKAVAFAIVASLIECLFILPLHYLDFGPKPRIELSTSENLPEKDNFILKCFRYLTEKIVALTLHYRISSVFLVIVAFITAISIFVLSITGTVPLIRIKFFPDDYHLYYVTVEGPTNTPLKKTSDLLKEISVVVMDDGPGMAESAAAFAGFYINEDYQQIFGQNLGMVMVTLPAKKDQGFDNPITHLDDIRQGLKKAFEKENLIIRVRAEKDSPPAGKDINIRIMGTNFQDINALAKDLMNFIKNEPQLAEYMVDIQNDQGQFGQVIRFRVRQERAQEYGLSNAQVIQLASSVLDGRFVGKFSLLDEEVDLKLRINPSFFKTFEDAFQIPLLEHPSGPVYLGDLCQIETYIEPGHINRYQGERSITLTANIKTGAPTSSPVIIKKISNYYSKIKEKYHGVSIGYGGEFETTKRSYKSLTYAFAIALLIIYVILATQFGSYFQPLIILSAVIFSLIGVIFGKLFTQSLFTINSFIAIVGVTGVVVNDSLVLIDFINRKYKSGMNRKDAIKEGIRIRLRPILLTTLTTSLGLLPMAIGIPSYSIVWGSMASTFVAGLATATGLTLFIVPVGWDLLEGMRLRLTKKKND